MECQPHGIKSVHSPNDQHLSPTNSNGFLLWGQARLSHNRFMEIFSNELCMLNTCEGGTEGDKAKHGMMWGWNDIIHVCHICRMDLIEIHL